VLAYLELLLQPAMARGSEATEASGQQTKQTKTKNRSSRKQARTPSAGLTSQKDDISFIHPYAPCHPNSILMEILSSKCNWWVLVGPILFWLVNFVM
jgi:hypothetical protein